MGSLPGPPLPSYHETPQFRTPYSSALHILVLFSDSSFLKQPQSLLGLSQPRKEGFQSPSPHPPTASLGVPSSPATSSQASFCIQPALYMLWTVFIASAKRVAKGRRGLGSRHLPRCSASWAQAGPLCLPSLLPFCRQRAGGRAAVSDITAPAKGYGQSQKLVDSKEQFCYRSAKRLLKALVTVRKLGWVFRFAF